MSIESAKAFMERMNTDEEFSKKVTDCKEKEACMELIKEAGFDFTADEIKELNLELSEVSTLSLESVKAFIERMRTDAAFAKKVFASKDNDELIEIVMQEGFDFSQDELNEVLGRTELTDEELDLVAGGTYRTLSVHAHLVIILQEVIDATREMRKEQLEINGPLLFK